MPEATVTSRKGTTLLDIPSYSRREMAEIAMVAVERLDTAGLSQLSTDERKILRLLATVLMGYADE